MYSRDCAVKGCPNSYRKLKFWKKSWCEKHGEPHGDCPCRLPFHLFRCPVQLPKICRLWTSAIDRDNFIPNKYCVVCSDHFLDGQPTSKNPIPQINLGPKEEKVVQLGLEEVHEDHTYADILTEYKNLKLESPPPSAAPAVRPLSPQPPPAVAHAGQAQSDSPTIKTMFVQPSYPVHDHNYAGFTTDWDDIAHSDHNYAFIITVEASESSVWGQYSVSPLVQACYSSSPLTTEDGFTEDQDLFYASVKQEVEEEEGQGERDPLVADQPFTSQWSHTTGGSYSIKQEVLHPSETADRTEDADSCDPFAFVSHNIKQEPEDAEADRCGSFQFVDVSNLTSDYQPNMDDMGRDLGDLDSFPSS